MKKINLFNYSLFLMSLGSSLAINANEVIEDEQDSNIITVSAELQENNLYDLPASISVITQETIEQNNAQHVTELFNLAPNVNFSSGASRGRFIQIRGVGERSQFVEPINPSVGVILDGIDLTGIVNGATALDIKQVEILRGPQGTLYGANALAGLINIVSNNPTDEFYSKISASVEQFDGRSLSAVVSNKLTDTSSFRFSGSHYESDGYMKNIFLNRDDTNNFDETSFKARFVTQFNKTTKVSTTLLYADIDNGYDAFSLDLNRNTYSDQPGEDIQKTKAASIIIDHKINDSYNLKATLSSADSDVTYSYDEDWSHLGICDGLTDCFSYSSFDNYQRENKNQTLDLLLRSKKSGENLNWALGFYSRNQNEELNRQYTFAANDFISEFDTQNRAIYGQIIYQLNEKLKLTSGLRFENRKAQYHDNNDISSKFDESFEGGNLALTYQYAKNKSVYGLISRGYKAGGFNANGSLTEEQRFFDSESMWNYEAGLKSYWADQALSLQASIFYQDRKNAQIKQSLPRSQDDGRTIAEGGLPPYEFIDYLDNAPAITNYGLELETQWMPTENLSFYSTVGLLNAKFSEKFETFNHTLADRTSIPPLPYDLNGHRHAHAPEYQFILGAKFFFSESFYFNPEVQSKDAFLTSNSHEERTNSYELINLRWGYQLDDLKLNFYINNMTDKEIQTRGFGGFGNDPRNGYAASPYYQFAAPRVIGISASMEFN